MKEMLKETLCFDWDEITLVRAFEKSVKEKDEVASFYYSELLSLTLIKSVPSRIWKALNCSGYKYINSPSLMKGLFSKEGKKYIVHFRQNENNWNYQVEEIPKRRATSKEMREVSNLLKRFIEPESYRADETTLFRSLLDYKEVGELIYLFKNELKECFAHKPTGLELKTNLIHIKNSPVTKKLAENVYPRVLNVVC